MEYWIAFGILFLCGIFFIAGVLICKKSEKTKEFYAGMAATCFIMASKPFWSFLYAFFKFLIFGDSE